MSVPTAIHDAQGDTLPEARAMTPVPVPESDGPLPLVTSWQE
jgi:hypothetical protein